MKQLLLTTSIIALMTGSAFAAGHANKSENQMKDAQATQSDVDIVGDQADKKAREEKLAKDDTQEKVTADTSAMFASNIIGKVIYNGEDETIGDVNDLVITQGGQIEAVIVGVGGFLGLGEKNVKIAFDDLSMTQEEQESAVRLSSTMTREQLEKAPRFVRNAGDQRP